jgi:hypothetical protein
MTSMIVGQMVNKMPAPHLRKKDDALIDSDTLLGVEVEVERCKSNSFRSPNAAYWTPKEDNSLRNGGMEFVFSEPLFGTDVIQAISWLFDTAKEKGWTISERTGIHVHMDVRGMDLDKFQNLVILYALLEPAIYRWVGDGRDRNIHCLPWYVADSDLDVISKIFKDPKNGVAYIKSIHRYAGLNLASMATFGTIEFRHLKTTFDRERMNTWINMILSLKKAAQAWTGKPHELIREMKLVGAYVFMHRVFGSMTKEIWYPQFAVDFRGTSVPVAEHLCFQSTELSSGDMDRLYQQSVQIDLDEKGAHPGIMKWKKRRAALAPPAPKIKKPSKPLVSDYPDSDSFAEAMATYNFKYNIWLSQQQQQASNQQQQGQQQQQQSTTVGTPMSSSLTWFLSQQVPQSLSQGSDE